ncbi:MAG: hypothetical protein ABW092_13200 [Candidatus Thiodiazotropha sp.]
MKSTKNPMLAFVHIEKAAGTTFIHILRKNYFPKYADVRPFYELSGDVFSDRDFKLMKRLIPGLKCIGGHSVVPHSDMFRNNNFQLVTILRDPIKRYMSQYQHWVEKKNISISFEEFLGYEELWNFQTKKISGDINIEHAKDILRNDFMLVGCVEKFDEFLVLLRYKLNNKPIDIRYWKKNIAHNKISVDGLIEKYRPEIIERNSIDIELHKFVLTELYSSYISEYRGSVSEAVENFKTKENTIGPSAVKLYIDYIFRKLYIETTTGIIRTINGKKYKGSY